MFENIYLLQIPLLSFKVKNIYDWSYQKLLIYFCNYIYILYNHIENRDRDIIKMYSACGCKIQLYTNTTLIFMIEFYILSYIHYSHRYIDIDPLHLYIY